MGKNQKCRRADIFVGIHPPVFADVGELNDLQGGFAYAGERKDLVRSHQPLADSL
jgi:hypothetical protein